MLRYHALFAVQLTDLQMLLPLDILIGARYCVQICVVIRQAQTLHFVLLRSQNSKLSPSINKTNFLDAHLSTLLSIPQDTDQVAHVPSTLTTPNVIAVAALQSDGTIWTGSNFGLKSVQFAAPGVRVSPASPPPQPRAAPARLGPPGRPLAGLP